MPPLPTGKTVAEQLRARLAQEKADSARQERDQILDAAVDQLKRARKDAEDAVARLAEKASALRELSRRSPDDASRSYTAYANAHIRTAGAILQGTKKAASLDRLVVQAKEQQEQIRALEERQRRQREVQAHATYIRRLELPADDAFEEIYGEILSDA